MTPDPVLPEDDPVIHALSAMQRHLEAATQALYSLHLQATQLQSVLCAVVDTHPDPAQLQRCLEQQMEHTLQQVRPHDLNALNSQTQAWVDRIHRRTLALATAAADATAEVSTPRQIQ